MNISDSTGGYRVTAFNEVAGSIFGMSVQAMGELKENDYNIYIKKIHEVELKKYTFVLKGRAQVYGVTNFIVHLIISLRLFVQLL